MIARSFLCGIVILSCLVCSQATGPALTIMSWLPKHRQFCNVSLSTGALTSCFALPNIYFMGISGAVYQNHIYIAAQNLSSAGTPWYALSISIDQKNIQWATSFNPNNYAPVMTSYSTSLQHAIIVAGNNGYTWLANSTNAFVWTSYGYGQQGTFDQSLQEFWGITSTTLYRQNILKQAATSIQNQYNIVLVAISSSRQSLYCVAQAADGTLLYVFDTYLNAWSFVGSVTGMVPVPFTPSVIDPTESYITFLASVEGKTSLVTLSLDSATVLYSIASPDPSMIMLQSF